MGLKAEDALAASIAYTDGVVTGDLKITETSDGGLQFSANGGSSVVVLGPDKVRGRGIKSAAINNSQHLIITYSDDEVEDLGLIKVKSDHISINENTEFKMNLKITKYDDNGNESEEITDNLKPAVIKVEEDGSNDDVNYRVNFTTYDENGNPYKTLTSPNMIPPKHNITPNENNNDYSFKVNISTKDENGTKLEITPNLKGNIFWEGVDIVGESMVFEVKAEDGINYSRKNDLYLNSETGDIYKRTDTGDVNNFWTKIGCLKGPIGKGAYQEAVEEGFSGTRSEWLLTLVGQSNLTEKRWQKPLISDESTDMQVWYYYQIDGNEPNTAWKYILTPPDGLYRAGNYAFNVNTKYYTFTSVQDLEIGGAGIYHIKYIADEKNGKLTAYLTNKETSEEIEYSIDIAIQSSVPEGFIEVPVSATLLGKWVQTMYLGSSKTNCEEITITTGMSLDGIITSDVFFGIIGDSVLKIGINVKDAINKIFDMIKSDPDAVLNTNSNSLFEAVNELVAKKHMDCYELVDSNLLDHCLFSEYKTLSANFIYCENCTNTPSGNNGYGYVMMIISQDTHYRQLIFFDPANGKISTNNIGANETKDGFGEWSGWNYGLTYNDITHTINSNSTDKQIPSAKGVYDTLSSFYVSRTVIKDVDLNSITTMGEYHTVNCTNKPINIDGYLKVYRCNDIYCLQEYSPLTTPYKYIREQVKGSWTGWQKFCTTSVDDVGVTNITFDSNGNYEVADNNCKYFIKNGICTILLNVKCISPIDGWLPVATLHKTLNFYVCGTLESNPGVDTLKCAVNTAGKLQLSQGTAGKTYIGSLMYQVAES